MKLLRVVAIGLSLYFVWLGVQAVAAEPLPADTATALEVIRKQNDLPALAVLVIKDGKICDRAAVGVRKVGDPTPVTTNDVFHIGSCTKSMTATLAAMFIDESKLNWGTTIATVFPELKDKMNPAYQTVTVEQLMQHRAGLPEKPPEKAWAKAWLQSSVTIAQRHDFVEAVLQQPPVAPPGTKHLYSNQGYVVLGAMLEKISGKRWEDLMTERLFKPLGMETAGFGIPGTFGKVDQPWGHLRVGGGKVTNPVQGDNPTIIGPAGVVHCSLDDLARYVMAHLNGETDGKLLKPETFRHLHTPPEGENYACGWVVLPRPWAGGKTLMHNGSNTMWYIVMWLAPKKNSAVIVATNVMGNGAPKACDAVVGAMVMKWLK